MKRNILLLMVFALLPFLKLSAQCVSAANIYSFTMNGKSYEIVKEMKNWADAAACALQRGGHLIYINNKLEQDSIYMRIIQGAAVSPAYTMVGDGGGASYLWIGATDKFTEGAWKWDGTNSGNGTAFWNGQGAAGAGGGSAVGSSFVYWGGAYNGASNEPDDYAGIQDCAGIALTEWPKGTTGTNRLGAPSEWNDLAPTNLLYYIIEYEPAAIDESGMLNNWEVYPNPAKNNLVIKTNAGENLYLIIYSSIGEKIVTQELVNNNTTIDIANLKQGFYLYTLSNTKTTKTGKLIIE